MARDAAGELADGARAYLSAPAGYGKTHSIAQAVAVAAGRQGRQLVLTHTHAGVHALQSKFQKLGVARAAWHVETIAGWALKYAQAFRRISGLADVPTKGGWEAVYPAALACLSVPAARDVLTRTYGGLFVDEYQDCTRSQHRLVLGIAELLPCRVVGDPLQGIFDFTGDAVDLGSDLTGFVALDPLTTPYRWLNQGQRELAEWLVYARERLLSGEAVDLAAPVAHVPPDRPALLARCKELMGKGGAAVVAHRFGGQAHDFAKGTGGGYRSMEEMECGDLIGLAKQLDGGDARGQGISLLRHARSVTSNAPGLRVIEEALEAGTFRASRYASNRALAEAIQGVLDGGGPEALAAAFGRMVESEGATVFRRELSRETLRTLKAMGSGKFETFEAAAVEIRERTRRIGRPPERRSSSRILLIKGLEFDHAVVADADALSPKELYVGITRGSRSLSVQSKSKRIRPPQPAQKAKKASPFPQQGQGSFVFE